MPRSTRDGLTVDLRIGDGACAGKLSRASGNAEAHRLRHDVGTYQSTAWGGSERWHPPPPLAPAEPVTLCPLGSMDLAVAVSLLTAPVPPGQPLAQRLVLSEHSVWVTRRSHFVHHFPKHYQRCPRPLRHPRLLPHCPRPLSCRARVMPACCLPGQPR
eukprot:scaffold3440_cov135-Isochrysis_galbana.AAC.9